MRKRLQCLTLLLASAVSFIYSESMKVEYYGVISDSSDSNMMKMAQDIFFTQLKSISYISVEDKRPDSSKILDAVPNFEPTQDFHIVFYAEIKEQESDGDIQKLWNCKFNAMNPEDQILHTKDESYDSYYKILSGAKSVIEDVISDFRESGDNSKQKTPKDAIAQKETTFRGNIDIESLSGTWYGEPYTDKVMILRGGRGFIIFKNGATMNIKISAKRFDNKGNATEIEVTQIGKSNASFFPELPRQTALNIASSAPTIKWTFSVDSGKLSGIKKTLIPTSDGLDAEEGQLEITWSKNKN